MIRVKKTLKKIICINKLTASIYFSMQYSGKLTNNLLISRIQQIAHKFDQRLMKSFSPNKNDVFEMEYLLNVAKKRGLKFDDSLMWSLSLYTLAKMNAIGCYKAQEREKRSTSYNSILTEIIKSRRSVRIWNNSKINIDLIKSIIETSTWAPSSCNRQPIRIIILDDSQKEFIKEYFYGGFWHKAPVQLLVLCNNSANSENESFFPYLDGGAFIQNMLLLLNDAGLGACWLGFKKWDAEKKLFCNRKEFEDFYEYFNIGKELTPISMVVVGDYDTTPKSPLHHSLDTVIIGDKK